MEIISINEACLNVFALWEEQNFRKNIFWKFLLIRIAETYQNKPKRFRKKRIDLKEMKSKSGVNPVYIAEKYPFGIDFQNTQMDK